MASSRSTKDKEMASYLKKKGIMRGTGKCPRSCGATFRLTKNGEDLLAHLSHCMGRPRQVRNKV